MWDLRKKIRNGKAQDEGGEENEEEQKKLAIRDNVPLVPGGRNEGFPVGSVFDASMLPRNSAGEPRGGDESLVFQLQNWEGPRYLGDLSCTRDLRRSAKALARSM